MRHLALILLLAAAPASADPGVAPLFGLEQVEALARELASQRYQPAPKLPAPLAVLDYDAYRELRFLPQAALWRDKGLLFQAQFFHLGFLYTEPVQLSQVLDGAASLLPYTPASFDYGKSRARLQGKLPRSLAYAGVRFHYPLHTPSYSDEVLVFQGASYFRFLGREQQYGLSARGLAVDTASPRGEEFPIFRHLWLEAPAPGSSTLVVYALLDSPSVTGAYRFELRPGDTTTLDVTARLFARKDIDKLGVAPLTSMHVYGEHRARGFDDVRPEVHDSDVLLVADGTGEHVLRPISNPRELQVTAFLSEGVRGFGLLQRDRDLQHYQDLEANYQRRPSYWVEPKGEWGPGHVELVEIPTDQETHDNIVAYWVSEQPLREGEARPLEYRLSSTLDEPVDTALGRVMATRIGSANIGMRAGKGDRLFAVDFAGRELTRLRNDQPVEAVVTASRGKVSQVRVQKFGDAWRAYFLVTPEGSRPIDLRCALRLRDRALSETWTYLYRGD